MEHLGGHRERATENRESVGRFGTDRKHVSTLLSRLWSVVSEHFCGIKTLALDKKSCLYSTEPDVSSSLTVFSFQRARSQRS